MRPIAIAPIALLTAVLFATLAFSGPVSMFSMTGLGILAMLGAAAVLVPVMVGLHDADSATDSATGSS